MRSMNNHILPFVYSLFNLTENKLKSFNLQCNETFIWCGIPYDQVKEKIYGNSFVISFIITKCE